MIQFIEHFSFSRYPGRDPIERVTGWGAPGQRLSLSFSIESEAPCSELGLDISELRGSSGVIPREGVELYVVQRETFGPGLSRSERRSVPGLLVKDDRVSYRGGYTRGFKHWRHLFRRRLYYEPPEARGGGPVGTSLEPGCSKQIWIDLLIPSHVGAGTFQGRIEARYPGGGRHLAVEIEVRSLRLLEPEADLLLWYKGTLDWRFPQHYVCEREFREQLKDIYAHGFRSVSISESREKLAQKAIAMVEAAGFRTVVLLPPFPEAIDSLVFESARPVFYVSDEMDAQSPPPIAAHVRWWTKAKALGRDTMCSLLSHSFAERLWDPADFGHAPETVSYYLPENRPFFFLHSRFSEVRRARSYYYWMAHGKSPDLHRVLAGVYLWKSKADGIAPYCYQHRPEFPASPFDGIDEEGPELEGAERRPVRSHMATYPRRGGSIPTVSWKALSEGIWDLRYLTTLAKLLETARMEPRLARLVREAEARIEKFLKRIDLRTIDLVGPHAEPYDSIRSEEYGSFREQIARDILALNEELAGRAA